MAVLRVLVVGAAGTSRALVREMCARPELGYTPAGSIDEKQAKVGDPIEGVKITGGYEEIGQALTETAPDEIWIALPSIHGPVTRRILDRCRDRKVSFRILPAVGTMPGDQVRVDQMRKLEPEDLLGRSLVQPDESLLRATYRGKRLMVTGAGGSIGSELARQALRLGPSHLVLVGRGENSLFDTLHTLRPQGATAQVDVALVDLQNPSAVKRALRQYRPQIVLHAAAHKHLTFMQRYPEEAILNNVVATRDLVDAAAALGVERLVALSTDKAVNPCSVLGASKRLVELLFNERSERKSPTRLMTVRFGNVLGTRGSVVPLFLRQIESGGPVTVSHSEAARYFMTVKEAATLVLEAGARGQGAEIFSLDMGEQIRILDLARSLITLSGQRPDRDIQIVFSGLRQGEKLSEDLRHSFEEIRSTDRPGIRVARRKRGKNPAVEGAIGRLETLARSADRTAIIGVLAELLPEANLSLPTEGRTSAESQKPNASAAVHLTGSG